MLYSLVTRMIISGAVATPMDATTMATALGICIKNLSPVKIMNQVNTACVIVSMNTFFSIFLSLFSENSIPISRDITESAN